MDHAGTPLTCLEMVARLDDYVDRQLTSDELRRVEAHLDGCVECAQEYRFEATILDGLRRRLQRIALPAHLLERVRARLAGEAGTKTGPEAL